MKIKLTLCLCVMLFSAGSLSAQSRANSKYAQNTNRRKIRKNFMKKPASLFQYGIADAFVNGIYEGQLLVGELKKHGNFGVGAPNLIDGELTMMDGKVYQTNAKGETFEAPDTLKSPLVFVSAFKADTVRTLTDVVNIHTLFDRIEQLLPDKNRIYAIRITGNFAAMKTRAFSPVIQKPFKPLSQLLDQQHVFNFEPANGAMIGFYMPGYLSGINIVGLHFHYLSTDFKHGGHVLEVKSAQVTVEIAEIDSYHLSVPNTLDFKKYNFNRGNSQDLNVIEKGKN
jgi:acetolactate decarboxylase